VKRFIHIPKTAGTAVKHWLCNVPEHVMCGNARITQNTIQTKRLHKRGWINEPSEKFTIVRNPYERCVSAYTYLIKENTRVPAKTTFENFIKKIFTRRRELNRYMEAASLVALNKKR